jgi:hypothetical protein
VIVEGCDGSGKTTLINQLSRDLGVPIKSWPEARNDYPTTGVHRRVFSSLAYEISASNKEPPVLHDRLYFSERVYGKLLRGQVQFNSYQQRLIEETLWALKIPIIFCRPPLEVVKANVAASAGLQLPEVPEHIEEIWNAYSRMGSGWKPQSCTYDYTGQTQPSSSYERLVDQCEIYLTRRSKRTWQS